MAADSHATIVEIVRLGERARDEALGSTVADHVVTCPDCRSVAEGYTALRRVLRDLPRPEPPNALQGEIADLVKRIAEEDIAGRKARRRLTTIAASAVGVAALAAIVGLLGWAGGRGPTTLESPTPATSPERPVPATTDPAPRDPSGPRPVFVNQGRSFSDTHAVEESIKEDPTVRAFRESYTAEDVGANQRNMQILLAEQARGTPGRSLAECMNVVLRAVPRPILPAYVERAKYRGTDAWLVVFVYAPDSAPRTPLSESIFYSMAVEDCRFLGTAFWS